MRKLLLISFLFATSFASADSIEIATYSITSQGPGANGIYTFSSTIANLTNSLEAYSGAASQVGSGSPQWSTVGPVPIAPMGTVSAWNGSTFANQSFAVQVTLDNSLFSIAEQEYQASDFVGRSAFLSVTSSGAAGIFIDATPVTPAQTPEPSSVLLFATGLAGAFGAVRRRFGK